MCGWNMQDMDFFESAIVKKLNKFWIFVLFY